MTDSEWDKSPPKFLYDPVDTSNSPNPSTLAKVIEEKDFLMKFGGLENNTPFTLTDLSFFRVFFSKMDVNQKKKISLNSFWI